MSNNDTTKEEDTTAIWDTFSAGGEYAHNMISLRLGRFEEKWGKKAARALYAELIEAGF